MGRIPDPGVRLGGRALPGRVLGKVPREGTLDGSVSARYRAVHPGRRGLGRVRDLRLPSGTDLRPRRLALGDRGDHLRAVRLVRPGPSPEEVGQGRPWPARGPTRRAVRATAQALTAPFQIVITQSPLAHGVAGQVRPVHLLVMHRRYACWGVACWGVACWRVAC